jgi:hypothetical protein
VPDDDEIPEELLDDVAPMTHMDHGGDRVEYSPTSPGDDAQQPDMDLGVADGTRERRSSVVDGAGIVVRQCDGEKASEVDGGRCSGAKRQASASDVLLGATTSGKGSVRAMKADRGRCESRLRGDAVRAAPALEASGKHRHLTINEATPSLSPLT